jgi:hypothetical protein
MTKAGKRPDPCDYDDLDYEKFGFTRRWNRLREALRASRRDEVYMSAREYYLAKRGEL